jgi:hypothetical protein
MGYHAVDQAGLRGFPCQRRWMIERRYSVYIMASRRNVLFPGDRLPDVAVVLVPDQRLDGISRGEAGASAIAMLKGPRREMVRKEMGAAVEARVDRAVQSGLARPLRDAERMMLGKPAAAALDPRFRG